MMDLKTVKCKIIGGSIARRVLLRAFLMVSAVSMLSLMHVLSWYNDGMFVSFTSFGGGDLVNPNRLWIPILGSIESVQSKDNANLTAVVARELIGMHLLSSNAKALCVGEGSASAATKLREMGFSKTCEIYRHPFFLLKQKKFIYELDYADNSFDFVFSRDLEKVTVPALLVLEIERVLSPGGIGAMLVGGGLWNPNGLIRSATPVSSLLKSSTVVHVSYVSEFTLVVFKKSIENRGCFEQYRLPADCASISNNKQILYNIEPLVEEKTIDFEKKIAYLPKFVDVASKQRLVYVDIGAGKHMNSNSTTNWFLPSYPLDHNKFNIYFVDYNTSVLLSYVKKPGITFVYHPALAGNNAAADSNVDDDDLDPYVGVGGFDFHAWFKETVRYSDFVVLKIGTGEVELKFLLDLFASGAICFVDELFLRCSEHDDSVGDCLYLFRSLRNSGVYVHQWWGE